MVKNVQLPSAIQNRPKFGENLVLSKKEWERIKCSSLPVTRKKEPVKEDHERKEKSKEISRKWPNKIADLRNKQLEARKLREDKLEEENVRLDLEEAQYQSQKRKEIIEKAKKQLYFQHERIRKLHGALLLSTVIKEREQQIELKKKNEHLFDDFERQYLANIKNQYEEYVQEKQDREEKSRKVKQQLAAELANQVTRKQEVEKKIKDEELKIGQVLKECDERFIEELLHSLSEKQKQQKQLLEEQQQLHKENLKFKNLEERTYIEECKKAELYAGAKRKIAKMKADREKEEFISKQQSRHSVREKIGKQLIKKLQEEEELYQRVAKEKEVQALEEVEKKRLARKQALTDCLIHSKIQMEEHHRQDAANKKLIAEELLKIEEDTKILHKEVSEKQQRHINRQKSYNKSLAQQIEEKQKTLEQDKASEKAQELKLYDNLDIEEKFFQEYAKDILEKVKEKGYNTLPVLRAAEPGIESGRGPVYKERGNIRPLYQASDVSGAPMQHILPQIAPKLDSPTAQRLGFQSS